MPTIKGVAKIFQHLAQSEILQLFHSRIHEERLLALLIMIMQYTKGSKNQKETIIRLYLENTKHTNNWDLVDLSAPKLLGDNLLNKSRQIIYKLADSSSIWERRIAIVSTSTFIKHTQTEDTFQISDLLINDTEDLIHKASGLMLREVSKKDLPALEECLKTRYKKLPRTTLGYTIEKFSNIKRARYLKGNF